MNVKNKNIWELSLQEIEYVYENLHMNNYVYAALKVFHESNMPLNKIIRIKENEVPHFLIESLENLINLAPYLGNYNSRPIRINYTFFVFLLYKEMSRVNLENFDRIIKIFSTVAYISILADKNDNLLLWKNPVIRQKTSYIENIFNKLIGSFSAVEISKMPLFDRGKVNEDFKSHIEVLYAFVPKAICAIIIMIENNIDKSAALLAFENVEKEMLKLEGLINYEPHNNNHRQKFLKQIRYRNTLYLYGGNLFERMGKYDKAYKWYTKDILFKELPDYLDFYLTSLKTCERLLCAHNISSLVTSSKNFSNLIKRSVHRSFMKASHYSTLLLDFIVSQQNIDLTKERIFTEDHKMWLYGGEAAREVFLMSLLYNKIVNNIPFKNIDYTEFFKY